MAATTSMSPINASTKTTKCDRELHIYITSPDHHVSDYNSFMCEKWMEEICINGVKCDIPSCKLIHPYSIMDDYIIPDGVTAIDKYEIAEIARALTCNAFCSTSTGKRHIIVVSQEEYAAATSINVIYKAKIIYFMETNRTFIRAITNLIDLCSQTDVKGRITNSELFIKEIEFFKSIPSMMQKWKDVYDKCISEGGCGDESYDKVKFVRMINIINEEVSHILEKYEMCLVIQNAVDSDEICNKMINMFIASYFKFSLCSMVKFTKSIESIFGEFMKCKRIPLTKMVAESGETVYISESCTIGDYELCKNAKK